MKSKILVLFFYIHIIDAMLFSYDICKLKKYDECTSSPYTYKCKSNTCAKSKHKCEEYSEVNRFLKSAAYKIIKSSIHLIALPRKIEAFVMEAEKRLLNFESKIKVCPNWHPENVCKRRKTCDQKRVFNVVFVQAQTTSMEKECPCSHRKNKYECNRDYCTLDKHYCDVLNQIKNMQENNLINSIKECSVKNRF